MSIGIVVESATLAVVVGLGICAIYAIFEMRKAWRDQREQFVRAISTIDDFHKLHPELMSLIKRIESDEHALQSIAIQIEGAVAALKDTAISSIKFAGDRQIATIETFRDHLDSQEQELEKILQLLSKNSGGIPHAQPTTTPQANPEPKADKGEYLRLRKEIVTGDPNVRFAVLKDWITLNWLAILRRAAGAWNTAADLIANVPSYLEPEAEVHDGCVLIVGTRGHAERLAVPIHKTDASPELHLWFETADKPDRGRHVPAVLIRSNDHFQLVSKGSAHEVVSGRTHI